MTICLEGGLGGTERSQEDVKESRANTVFKGGLGGACRGPEAGETGVPEGFHPEGLDVRLPTNQPLYLSSLPSQSLSLTLAMAL